MRPRPLCNLLSLNVLQPPLVEADADGASEPLLLVVTRDVSQLLDLDLIGLALVDVGQGRVSRLGQNWGGGSQDVLEPVMVIVYHWSLIQFYPAVVITCSLPPPLPEWSHELPVQTWRLTLSWCHGWASHQNLQTRCKIKSPCQISGSTEEEAQVPHLRAGPETTVCPSKAQNCHGSSSGWSVY